MAPGAAPASQDGASSTGSVCPFDGCWLNSASPAAGREFSWRKNLSKPQERLLSDLWSEHVGYSRERHVS